MAKFYVTLSILCIFGAVFVRGGRIDAVPLEDLFKQCQANTGATEGDVSEILKGGDATTYVEKCLLSCVLRTAGLFDGSGKINQEIALEVVNEYLKGKAPENTAAVINNCAGIEVSADPCDSTYQYVRCVTNGLSG